MKHILVIGGAGYIGSYMCKYLSKQGGYLPIVLDNLVYGHKEAVKWGPFFKGPMEDQSLIDHLFSTYSIDAVMHFAAFCYVGESTRSPLKYYQNNVVNTLGLLESMIKRGVLRFVFSSSCATYGIPKEIPIRESHPQHPISPYGKSKLMVEQILKDAEDAYGLASVSLRYFNAAGADPDGECGEDHTPETHLIPLVLKAALGENSGIHIFGDDYPTKDGTCIRDYIHIHDLAQAHFLALENLLSDGKSNHYNLSIGKGYSVKEVIDTAVRVSGRSVPYKVVERRPGDPAELVGSNEKDASELGWNPTYTDLYRIIDTAWKWHKQKPDGYAS